MVIAIKKADRGFMASLLLVKALISVVLIEVKKVEGL
jgi:hypothetical protein